MEKEFIIRDALMQDFQEIRKLNACCGTSYIGPLRGAKQCRDDFFRHYATYRLLAYAAQKPDELVGYAEVRNYPYLYALPGEHWIDLLNKYYCLTESISVTNLLFFNFCITTNSYNPNLLKALLREVFFRNDHLRFILVIEPPNAKLLDYQISEKDTPGLNYNMFDGISRVFYPRVFSFQSCRNTQKVHVISRAAIIDKMTYRKALPEDNDDIIEVIDAEKPELRQVFGDYYIAQELLNRAEQHTMLIVTEVYNQTAGFVWLNDDVDIKLIIENYEMDSLHNLIKYDRTKRTHRITVEVGAIEKKGVDKLFTHDTVLQLFERDYIGSYSKKAKLSCITLSSKSQLRVLSINGEIETRNDISDIREEYFYLLDKITIHLQTHTHYSYHFKKEVEIIFNVPNDFDSEDELLPDNSNVFALRLFGMHLGNNDMRRLAQSLLAAFAAYPNRDYCVFSYPFDTKITENMRFILKYFVRIYNRPSSRLTDELWIAHRSAIFGEITLHDIRREDMPAIQRLILKNVPHYFDEVRRQSRRHSKSSRNSVSFTEATTVNKIIHEVFNKPFSEYTVKTIRCGRSDEPVEKTVLVGFVILRPFRKAHLLTLHYSIPHEFYSSFVGGEIVTLRLHPFYKHNFYIIFRELARLTQYFQYYYFQSLQQNVTTFPNDLLTFMHPVDPKHYNKTNASVRPFDPSDGEPDKKDFCKRLNYVTDNYAVYWHNLNETEFSGSERPLVIIGLSPISKAFLRSLIFNWNVPGNETLNRNSCVPLLRVIVITPPGYIDAEYDKGLVCKICKKKGETCFIDRTNWSDFVGDVTRRMDIRKYVNKIEGHIKHIDRERRCIILKNNCKYFYETLLLLCDTSFGYPKPIDMNYRIPANYIHINNRFDRIIAYHKIQVVRDHLKYLEGKSVVVYGAHLRTYEFIQFLLEHDIPAVLIKLVIPYQKGMNIAQTIYNQPVADEHLEVVLQKIVLDLGIQVYENKNFSSWTLHPDEDGNIKSTQFIDPNGNELILETDMFVSFYETFIDSQFVDVLQKSGIQMNRRNIVVDDNFRTNDPSIYALGNYIEHDKQQNHQYKFVSFKEAAEKLIYKLGLLERQLQKPFEPKFLQPHSCEVAVSMGYRVFKVTMPKRYMANHLDNEYSYSMVTHDGTFCRVRLNPSNIVEEIVCVTKEKISFQFLLHFVGRHESLLNNMRARYCNGEISSFLDFFQEPWTELIMHEKFQELMDENRKILIPWAMKCMDLNVQRNQRVMLFKNFAQKKNLSKKLETEFLKFITENLGDIRTPIALPGDFPTYQPSVREDP